MRKISSLSIVLALVMMVAFAVVPAAAEEDVSVGIVFSTGGLGDLSFNDSAHRGLTRAEEELGVEYRYYEPSDPSEDETALRNFANRGYDLIMGIGFQMADTLEIVARDYPNTNFAHVDQDFGKDILDNVVAINFKEWDGSFLAGALAALVTETDVVGYVGGIDSPLIQRFEGGFYQGVKYIDSDIKVNRRYADSFGDPARGREIALGMVDDGADVIYHAAGGSGTGVFQAAGEEEIYAIGVDSNQNFVEPGYGIASLLKRVDNAAYDTVKSVIDGTFRGGENLYFGLDQNAVELTSLTEVEQPVLDAVEKGIITEEQLEEIKTMKKEVTAQYSERIAEIKQKIIDGEIEVQNWGETGRPENLE